MTPNKDWFESYKLIEVLLGNNERLKLVGIGSIKIKMHNRIERVLHDIRHIPKLKINLISLGTFDTNDYSYKAEGGVLRVTCVCLVYMKGHKDISSYILKGSAVIRVAATATPGQTLRIELWPQRLAYVSEQGLQELRVSVVMFVLYFGCGQQINKS